MIEAEQVEDGDVQVVDMHLVPHGGEASFVGRAVDMAPPLMPPPASKTVIFSMFAGLAIRSIILVLLIKPRNELTTINPVD